MTRVHRSLPLLALLAVAPVAAQAATLWSAPLSAESPEGFRCSVTNAGSSPRTVEICIRNAFSGTVVGICRTDVVQPGRGWVPPGWGEDGFYVCEIRVEGSKTNIRGAAFVRGPGGSTVAAVPAE